MDIYKIFNDGKVLMFLVSNLFHEMNYDLTFATAIIYNLFIFSHCVNNEY